MSRSRRYSPYVWYHTSSEWEALGNRCLRRRNRQVIHTAYYDNTPELHDLRTLGPYRNYDPTIYEIAYNHYEHRRCFWLGPCDGQYGFRGHFTCPAFEDNSDFYKRWLLKARRK
jgi:hypothetical protein